MTLVNRETAELDFARFAECMDLDFEEANMTEEDLDGFRKQKRVVLSAIQSGHVTVDDAGQPTVHLKFPIGDLQSVTFREPTGATFLAMDQKKKNQDVSKTFAMIQAMLKVNPGTLSDMQNRDLRVVQAIGLLFLG